MGNQSSYKNKIEAIKCVELDVVLNGTSDSSEIDLKGGSLVSIIAPGGIASSTITIKSSNTSTADGGTFRTIYDGLGVYGAVDDFRVGVAASKESPIPPAIGSSLGRYIKLTPSASESSKTYKVKYRNFE